MKTLGLTLILISSLSLTSLSAQVPAAEKQIAWATMAVPEDDRADATVLGYSSQGELVTLRKGSNQYICLADNPNTDGFSVASYHKSLEPFMARGRVLKKEGLSFQEIFDKREEEVKSGSLKMPDKATLSVVSGIFENGEPAKTKVRYVIYIPYATPESTGLPASPQTAGGAWIMNPGTHRAHIMVTPN